MRNFGGKSVPILREYEYIIIYIRPLSYATRSGTLAREIEDRGRLWTRRRYCHARNCSVVHVEQARLTAFNSDIVPSYFSPVSSRALLCAQGIVEAGLYMRPQQNPTRFRDEQWQNATKFTGEFRKPFPTSDYGHKDKKKRKKEG
jgi:hypothetical protein